MPLCRIDVKLSLVSELLFVIESVVLLLSLTSTDGLLSMIMVLFGRSAFPVMRLMCRPVSLLVSTTGPLQLWVRCGLLLLILKSWKQLVSVGCLNLPPKVVVLTGLLCTTLKVSVTCGGSVCVVL